MRLKLIFPSVITVMLLAQCGGDTKKVEESSSFISPEAGRTINVGDTIDLQVKLNDQADSVVYFADGERLSNSVDEQPVRVKTDKLALGIKAITAKIYRNGTDPEEISTSITLKSSLIPIKIGYTVIQEFKHDTESYTQGLEYHNGFFYESDGLAGESSIRKVEPSTGKVLLMTPVDNVFAEGMTIVGDKILMLTYKENINMVYDLNTLKLLRQYPTPYSRDGWGLCNDGNKIYNSDGTNMIHILNKETYMEEGFIEVYDHNGPINSLNELEYIDGKIYANIYESNRIVVINPANGQVTAEIDLSNIYPKYASDPELVLNGIAWDAQGKRLFVTGKKWDKLFQIKLSTQPTL